MAGRSPLVPVVAALAAVVLGLALGAALLGQRGTDPGGVAQPGATATPAQSPTTTSAPASEVPATPVQVFFSRDLNEPLPVLATVMTGSTPDTTPDEGIDRRIIALLHARDAEVPPGATNALANAGRTGSERTVGLRVEIDGDLATVTFDFRGGGWNVRGSALAQAALKQLVYTITEEPGIRRALIKEAGKDEAVIDQLVIDEPLTREDVLPYEGVKTEERIALEDDPRPSTATTRVENIVGGVRFVVELKANEPPAEGFWSPRVSAELQPNDDERTWPGKAQLVVTLPGVMHDFGGFTPQPQAGPPPRFFESSPLRALRTTNAAEGVTYRLMLDDARPWRVSLEPATVGGSQGGPVEPGTMRLMIDIGGHPQSVSDSIAVYDPSPGADIPVATTRVFRLQGTARAFEAHVSWRLKDASDREVATGFVTASLGTSPVWGTFTTDVQVPANVTGVVTLEVFWPSPRDGADVGTVAIPLRVR